MAVPSCGAILSSFQIGLSFFLHICIKILFGDEVYPLASTTNSISLIADSRMMTNERLIRGT